MTLLVVQELYLVLIVVNHLYIGLALLEAPIVQMVYLALISCQVFAGPTVIHFITEFAVELDSITIDILNVPLNTPRAVDLLEHVFHLLTQLVVLVLVSDLVALSLDLFHVVTVGGDAAVRCVLVHRRAASTTLSYLIEPLDSVP